MAEGNRVKAPDLNPSSVVKAVEGVDWRRLRLWLSVPDSICIDEIPTEEERMEQVRYWLDNLPTPSWRRVITVLDGMGNHQAAEKIKQYSEPLTDPTLELPMVTTVLRNVLTKKWFEFGGLGYRLRMPESKQNEIKRQSTTDEEKRRLYVEYWLEMASGASWERLAGALYYIEAEAALEEARTKFQRQKDPSLTLDILHTATKGVRNLSLLGRWIDVPWSKLEEIKNQYSSDDQQLKALLEVWLKTHPAPSWRLLAEALYQAGEYDLLQRVREQYITGNIYEAITLSSSEVDRYRHRVEHPLAAPLILRLRDKAIFCSLITFLLSPENHFPAPWEPAPNSSSPVCFRNCVEFSIPKYPGSIILIHAGDFLEIHVDIKHDEVGKRKCPELCCIANHAVVEGLRKAATNCEPQREFFCPCGKGSSHSATIGVDETYWVCSKNTEEYGDLQLNQLIWLSTTAKAGHHKSVSLHPANAVEISDVLTDSGFSRADWDMLAPRLSKGIDVGTIRQEGDPERCLQETIRQWLQKDTEASWEKLADAVAKIAKYGAVLAENILRNSRTDLC